MNKTREMVEALEDFIIKKVKTSTAEISALAELVSGVSMFPRTLEAISLNEFEMDSLSGVQMPQKEFERLLEEAPVVTLTKAEKIK